MHAMSLDRYTEQDKTKSLLYLHKMLAYILYTIPPVPSYRYSYVSL